MFNDSREQAKNQLIGSLVFAEMDDQGIEQTRARPINH